jgi:hypothetical protein
MSNFVTGHGPLACAVVEALGLDPRKTRRISLHLPCDGLATVEAEMFADEEQGGNVVHVLREFNLVAVGTAIPPATESAE